VFGLMNAISVVLAEPVEYRLIEQPVWDILKCEFSKGNCGSRGSVRLWSGTIVKAMPLFYARSFRHSRSGS
jgi:hypothetical protein